MDEMDRRVAQKRAAPKRRLNAPSEPSNAHGRRGGALSRSDHDARLGEAETRRPAVG
jgi:hypothetical protein